MREREAEGLPRPKEKNSRCRSFGEAWATENLGFIGREENRAGRTELMPNESEACVESGSGHRIDARAGFSGVWCGLLERYWRMFVFVGS